VHGPADVPDTRAEAVRVLLLGASEPAAARVRQLLADSAAMRFALTHAQDLEQMLARPEAPRFDVLLLCLTQSDPAAVARARATAPALPLVALADAGDESAALSALQRGAHGYVVADELSTRSLVAAIATALENHRTILQLESARERARHLATHDSLTGLANRAQFADLLAQAMFRSGHTGETLAVLLIDLDRFKTINDSFGNAVGDGLLRSLSRRINECLRSSDLAARLGGDEFAVLLAPLASPNDTHATAHKLLAELSEPIHFRRQITSTRCSIGIALFPRDSRDAEQLIHKADTAMRHAKESGGNAFLEYREEMGAAVQKHLALEERMRAAIDEGGFVLHYQPVYDLTRNRIVGAEALLRWQHPELGLLAPGEFLPIAEETGLILPIGDWVLRAACEQHAHWIALGHRSLRMSVNVSPQQFLAGNLAETVRAALAASDLASGSLELEITESSLLRDVNAAVETLARLKDLGVRIAIDDFGTGYSALAYLKQLPIDSLKIDQSFVRSLTTDPADATITETIVKLAAGLNLTTIAEGVETFEQLLLLGSYGCKRMQGFLFGKPVPPDTFVTWLENPPFRWLQGGDAMRPNGAPSV
jgi:diguanylate cyclase (GGDEF)-like protein